jgi:hypothetical protein
MTQNSDDTNRDPTNSDDEKSVGHAASATDGERPDPHETTGVDDQIEDATNPSGNPE